MADAKLGRLCAAYIGNASFIGVLYGVVPVLLWFGACFALMPFREVYLLRLVLALALAGLAGACLNRFGLELWLLKHESAKGPATVCDGFLIGAGIGVGIALLPPLTALIGSNHPEEAKLFIIAAWLFAAALGGIMGACLASVGRCCLPR